MSSPSNLQVQLQVLAEIKKQNPYITHVYMRTDDDRLVDIPIAQAEWTLRQFPTNTVEPVEHEEISAGEAPASSHAHVTSVSAGAPSEDISVPPRPSEEIPAPKSRKRAAK